MGSVALSPSYDEVPYEGGIVAGTHPEHLATIGRLFGVKAAPAESCSVLEIGCAAAGNLLPMAYGLPKSTFVGIDRRRSETCSIRPSERTSSSLPPSFK